MTRLVPSCLTKVVYHQCGLLTHMVVGFVTRLLLMVHLRHVHQVEQTGHDSEPDGWGIVVVVHEFFCHASSGSSQSWSGWRMIRNSGAWHTASVKCNRL